MAIKRYWRLVGVSTPANGALELSELRLYEGGVAADSGATLTATIAPLVGSLSDLYDSSTSAVVSWPFSSYSQSGWALVWDFGAGGGVTSPLVRVGSGASKDTFAADFLLQYSDDGITWTTKVLAIDVAYPGAYALTSEGILVAEPNFNKMVFACNFSETLGFTDRSPLATPITVNGAVISLDRSVFGVGGSAYFDGTGKRITLPNNAARAFSNKDFKFECWLYKAANNSNASRLWSPDGDLYDGLSIGIDGSGYLFVYASSGGASWDLLSASTVGNIALANNQWYRLAVMRKGGSVYGVINTTRYTLTTTLGTQALYFNPSTLTAIGGQATGTGRGFNGYISDLSVTIGGVVNIDDLALPVTRLLDLERLIESAPEPSRWRVSAAPARALSGSPLPDGAAVAHMREHTFFDAYNGGLGTIVGTVKEKNTPSNTPLRRRVLLIDEASRMTIRETWSDPVTGAFEFRGIKQGVKYSTISYDHLHNYRAVIADNQDAS